MKIILNGRQVGNWDSACYFENKACFKKRGLKKQLVLHESYHHLVYVKGLDMPIRMEEKNANNYAKEFLKN